MLNFLMPEIFGSQSVFHDVFNLEEDASIHRKEQMIQQLHQVLEPFMLRRLKSDVEHSLPVDDSTLLTSLAENRDHSLRGNVLLAKGVV